MRALQSAWIIFAAFWFGVMAVFVKFAAAELSVLEIVFYRSLLGVVFVLSIAKFRRRSLLTSNLRVHCWRSFTGFISLSLFFYALPKLHLSTSMALLQTSPLFFALLTAIFLRERMSPILLFALGISFIGMLFVLRPGVDNQQLLAGCAAIGAGIAAGAAYFNVRRLGILNEGGIRTVFYFSLISTILAAMLIAGYGNLSALTARKIMWIIAIGATATIGQLSLTQGLHYGTTLVSSSLMYSSIIFVGILDYLFWNSIPDALSWFGITLVMSGGIGAIVFNLHATKKAARQQP